MPTVYIALYSLADLTRRCPSQLARLAENDLYSADAKGELGDKSVLSL